MGPKNGFAVSESDRRLIREHSYHIREALFGCMTETQVECSVAFARYLSRVGINSENYWLFLRLIITNNPWVIDELLHERTPRLLFSTVRPEAELVEVAFQTLFSRHPEEIYPPALEALLGIVESAYFDADDGYRVRKLSIMDINALGKFLLKDEPQEHHLNRLILDILDRITRLGDYFDEPEKSVLSKHAFNVRYAYFDSTRELVDAIPQPLLVRVPDFGVSAPEEDFADLVTKRRARKRDAHGRFMKSTPDPLPEGSGEGGGSGAAPRSAAEPAAPVGASTPGAADAAPQPPKPSASGKRGSAGSNRSTSSGGGARPRKPSSPKSKS